MDIAILGWGSLLWDPRWEFDTQHEEWKYDGPKLKLEFSRISSSRDGALTLVIDELNGVDCQVAWCKSKRSALEDAIADLRCREGTTIKNIHVDLRSKGPAASAISIWARSKRIDCVIWTGLTSNFDKKSGIGGFSVQAATTYLQGLSVQGKARAAEYVWRAPAFIETPLRQALQSEPWFAHKS